MAPKIDPRRNEFAIATSELEAVIDMLKGVRKCLRSSRTKFTREETDELASLFPTVLENLEEVRKAAHARFAT